MSLTSGSLGAAEPCWVCCDAGGAPAGARRCLGGAFSADPYRVLSRFSDGRRERVGLGHSGVVLWGVDGRTVSLGALAVVLAVALGAWAGAQAGALAGVLASLAGLVPPAVLAVAMERRARTAAVLQKQQEVLDKYAPPGPAGEGENEW